MSEGLFRVLVTGRTLAGTSAEQAIANFSVTFRIPIEKARSLIGRQVVVRRQVDEQAAKNYVDALAKTGFEAFYELDAVEHEAVAARASAPPPVSSARSTPPPPPSLGDAAKNVAPPTLSSTDAASPTAIRHAPAPPPLKIANVNLPGKVPPSPPPLRRDLAEGMVFCRGCGKAIHSSAITCPHCGAPHKSTATGTKSKTTAALLALFLGGLGVHKFYLGQTGAGIVYLLFCWTFIPGIIAFIEFIIYLTMSDEAFASKYR